MKKVSILALKDATINCIDSTYQIFNRVNDFQRYMQKPDFYKVEIVGLSQQVELSNGLYNIRVNETIDQVTKTDLIIIPIICSDFSKTAELNIEFKDWVVQRVSRGAEVMSLCVGSFFLASTGLLDNRKCSVHWASQNEFAVLYPNVELVNDTLITDENGIYTCGGGYSYLTLILYILEKHLGRSTAVLASKMFEIEIDRKSQNPFMIFLGQKKHEDQTILEAQEFIESNPTELFSVDKLSNKFNLGRRTFERRFKKNTGNSVAEYIQRVKVEFTKKELETNQKTVNEIIYELGYNDTNSFRKVFRKFTDLTMKDYRKKFQS